MALAKHLAMVICLFFGGTAQAQDTIRVMSYNVQNLFDTQHDEGFNDWAFLPASHHLKRQACERVRSERRRQECLETDWTPEKLELKLQQIARVVTATGPQPPDLLAVVEIENDNVAGMLARQLGYNKWVISNGPDPRGIDVALFVRETSSLRVDYSREHAIATPANDRYPRRPILEVGLTAAGQRLIVFVNHWPAQSAPLRGRLDSARVLRDAVSSVQQRFPDAHVLAMGDFNVADHDQPHPFHSVLLQEPGRNLIDVDARARHARHDLEVGTAFYMAEWRWDLLDRFFASFNMMDRRLLDLHLPSYQIFSPVWMTQSFSPNANCTGCSPTRVPFRHNLSAVSSERAGFSDHFPILIDVHLGER